jgi:hypothetical protein
MYRKRRSPVEASEWQPHILQWHHGASLLPLYPHNLEWVQPPIKHVWQAIENAVDSLVAVRNQSILKGDE